MVLLVPFGKTAEAFANADGGAEAVVGFEAGAAGEGDGHVAGLQGDQLPVGGEVVVGGQDPGADQLLLERGDVVQQVLRRAAADVVDRVGGQGQAVFPGGLLRRDVHRRHVVVLRQQHRQGQPHVTGCSGSLDRYADNS